ETGSTAGSGRSGRDSGGSSPPRYRRRRAAPARAPRSLRPALRACGCSSLFLAERFQAGGDLLERLGERLVEFSVRRLGGAAQRIAHAVGGRAVLAQFPQHDTPASRAVAAACRAQAALVVRARVRGSLPLAVLAAWRRAGALGPRRWIPGGGAHPRAVVGQLLGGLE